ncbi:ATP-grasp domain-containing protein [Yinghuangia seranimata]|uniref:ATP-grasp domain-containing protein n=1 Tax=Yinghuangia seranimata TaxID=408067 RepID=UPI00248B0B8E|nr:alpha-L-glutamate ligase [Yinghuangia seranimata]MDI2124641.1 alpha-L-glutamate ligase [Yinghuangia seranimata]
MRIAVIVERDDHAMLVEYAALMRARGHEVAWQHPGARRPDLSADLYLLKSRTPRALRLGRRAEALGAAVCNTVAATEACVDRAAMAAQARAAGLPFPVTHVYPRGAAVSAPGRLIMKSRYCRHDEPLPVVGEAADLRAAGWRDEPVIAQEFAEGDGWDHKFWVIGDRVFAGLRRPPLDGAAGDPKHTVPVPNVPSDRLDLARAVGGAFGLRVYGVDIIASDAGPVVVDVNAFPGFSGLPGAAEALADLTPRVLDGDGAEGPEVVGQFRDVPERVRA